MSSIYTKADSDIAVQVGDEFVVELEGNPTTGYEWQLKFDTDKLTLTSQQYKQKSSAVGAGGVQHFKLKASKPGQATILAIYKRSWEANSLEEHTFNVKITK